MRASKVMNRDALVDTLLAHLIPLSAGRAMVHVLGKPAGSKEVERIRKEIPGAPRVQARLRKGRCAHDAGQAPAVRFAAGEEQNE
jgi:hypothetical protein